MGETFIVNGQVYIGRRFEGKTLCLSGRTLRVLEPDAPVPAGAEVVDASGKRIVPGFIDIHTHGGVGVDVNGATAEDLEKISRFFAGNGTTSWLCSVLTDTVEQTEWCIDQFKAHKVGEQPTSELLGIHLEGPFLAAEYKGAMPEHLLRKGDPELLRSYQERAEGNIRYITLSPEVEGAVELILAAKRLGIVPAIGHSGASYEQSMEAIAAGAAAATHTFNAMGLFHQHRPAIMGAVLESDVYCEMICDGRHLHQGAVRLLIKTKGLDKVPSGGEPGGGGGGRRQAGRHRGPGGEHPHPGRGPAQPRGFHGTACGGAAARPDGEPGQTHRSIRTQGLHRRRQGRRSGGAGRGEPGGHGVLPGADAGKMSAKRTPRICAAF